MGYDAVPNKETSFMQTCLSKKSSSKKSSIVVVPFLAAALLLLLTACGPSEQAPAAPDPDLSPAAQGGRELFTKRSQPPCGMCHTLKHAGTAAVLGPDLDTLADLDVDRVRKAITEGTPLMRPVGGLTPVQIEILAHYVVEVSGR